MSVRFRIDLTPLRASRDFRILFGSGTVFALGLMFGFVAVPYQLFQLTGSSLAVGIIGAVELVPFIVFGLYGGSLSDRLDRRTVQLVTGAGQVLLAMILLINALLDAPQAWLLYAVAGLTAVLSALQRPSRDALLPRVVDHEDIPAAVALSSFGLQLGMLVGPAAAGLVIAGAGLPAAYAIEAIGLGAATVCLLGLRRHPPTGGPATGHLAAIGAGLRYVRQRRDLVGTYLVDLVAMVLAMPIVLFPAFALQVVNRPDLLGLLYAAGAVGSLITTLTSGWTRRVRRHGRAVALAAIGWGAAIALAGLAPNVWITLLFLVLAGGLDTISGLFRSVIWNQTVPDALRGRLAGIEMISFTVGPVGGQLRSGIMADLSTVRTAIVSGGILCVVGVAAVAVGFRELWRYDSGTDEHAVNQRTVRTQRRIASHAE
ncbi:MFS transporter [Microlunatus sp. GCM10028923]|uniref:MFS transporter n=1 Tax=Microlunatus sp. GCM10028923 TaxID=3273400 RepID=UPI00360A82C0